MGWLSWRDGLVRITHLPSGEVTECDMSRSHYRNRDMAKKMLRGKLWAIQNGAGRQDTLVRSYHLPEDEQVLDGDVDITPRRQT